MSGETNIPVIAGIEISTDSEGRFNLNALHRAHLELSPGLHRNSKQPADWLKLEGTKELIGEISNSEDLRFKPVDSRSGRYGGTFAHELLAISYAGWISPAFQLQVNQVFLDFRTGKLQSVKMPTPKEFAELLLESAIKNEELEAANQVLALENTRQAEKIDNLENFFRAGMTITAFGKMLNGVNCSQINNFCCDDLNWLYNESRSGKSKRWRVRSYARDRYLTETDRPIGTHGGKTFIKYEPKLLQKGARKLYRLYLDSDLPMKKTWNGEFSHLQYHGQTCFAG